MKTTIDIKGISKRFGQVQAVDNVSFSVGEGEMLAYLGENGAGKSTTIHMLTGELTPDGGEITVCGMCHGESGTDIRRKIGVVFQSSVLDKVLTVKENLVSRAALYGIVGEAAEARIAELSELLDFSHLLRRTLGKLSGGERRRIDIARALLHAPSVLILDEPTTGLDPNTRRLLWSTIGRLRREAGLTVLLTTHYMEEATDADRIVILDRGRVVAEGTPLELKNRYAGDYVYLYGVRREELPALSCPVEDLQDGVRLTVESTAEAAELIRTYPALFSDFEVTKGRMDDVFLAVTGRHAQEEEA